MTDMEKLREIALDQNGFVTASQAERVGVSRPTLSYLLKHDRVERPRRGVYRIPQVQATRFDVFRLALLWTGDDDAVISHESALDLYDVCDIVPDVVHVAVPPSRRIAKSDGAGFKVHREKMADTERIWVEELPTVTPYRAIVQCVEYGTPSYLLKQAARGCLDKMLISAKEADELERMIDGRGGEQDFSDNRRAC